MIEWILVISLHTQGLNAAKNYMPQTIGGFQSESSCVEAAKIIGDTLKSQARSTFAAPNNPVVLSDCV